MADHSRFQSLERDPGRFQQFNRGDGGTRAEFEFAIDDVADRGRVHALDVFQWMNGRLQLADRQMPGHRALQDDPGDPRVGIEIKYRGVDLSLRDSCREMFLLKTYAHLGGGPLLVAHIQVHRRVIANADRDKFRVPAIRDQFLDPGHGLLPHAGRQHTAIDVAVVRAVSGSSYQTQNRLLPAFMRAAIVPVSSLCCVPDAVSRLRQNAIAALPACRRGPRFCQRGGFGQAHAITAPG